MLRNHRYLASFDWLRITCNNISNYVCPIIQIFGGMSYSLDEELLERVRLCKALVVGAGGIGCELVKNLVLAGFKIISLVGSN